MKKIIMALVLLSLLTSCRAQSLTGAKMYGFRQSVTGGKKPTKPVAEHNEALDVANHPRKNTWLYLVLPQGSSATVCEIYIDGKKYKVKSEKVVKTPVVYTDASIPDEPKTTVMVPHTKRPVLRLTPVSSQTFRGSAALQKLVRQNEAVAGYRVKGKMYFTPLKKFTWIEPALMQ